jgi:hypothetical protein
MLGFQQVTTMVFIRFPDDQTERRAIGFLMRHFSCKSWANGQTLVPEAALSRLAEEGIPFHIEPGAIDDEQQPPAVRNTPAA